MRFKRPNIGVLDPFEAFEYQCNAYYDPNQNTIKLSNDLKGIDRALVLTHELGHWFIDNIIFDGIGFNDKRNLTVNMWYDVISISLRIRERLEDKKIMIGGVMHMYQEWIDQS